MDFVSQAGLHLRKTLLKVKAIATCSYLPPSLSSDPGTKGHDTTSAKRDAVGLNVFARLCKTTVVQEVMSGLIDGVMAELKLGNAKDGGIISDREKVMVKSNDGKDSKGKKDDDEEFNGFSSELEDMSKSDDLNDGDDDVDEFQAFQSRLASDSEEEQDQKDDDGKLKTLSDIRSKLLQGNTVYSNDDDKTSSSQSEDDDIGLVDDSDLDQQRSSSLTPSTSSDTIPTKKANPKPASSTFVPSLTMGGYISGSDSGVDEEFEDKSNQKKNRRGQRARRAIWEQKYGKEAKHVQPGSESRAGKGDNRNAGWDARRGASDETSYKYGAGRRGGAGNVFGQRAGKVSTRPMSDKKNDRDDTGPLHPSWEAAKKRKEAGGMQMPQFAGKKMTFD